MTNRKFYQRTMATVIHLNSIFVKCLKSRVILTAMSIKEFEYEYKRLNPKQREAVDTIDGPVMVIAGPGTGKTSILTLRIANILKQTDTSPDSILALTFTESGVRAMRQKLVELMGALAYRLHIHTFHSFSNELIKRYPQEFPRIIGSQHITEFDQIRIMEEVIDETAIKRLRPPLNRYYFLGSCLKHIKELKREDIDVGQFGRLIDTKWRDFKKIPDLRYKHGQWKGEIKGKYKRVETTILNDFELLKIYKTYQEKLRKERLYDFEDMIMEVVKKLRKKNDLLLILQEEYQYILADEHQDANNAQNRLLDLLSGFHNNPNLFIVGDEKQAIFRFQGASLENFLYFEKKYPRSKIIKLTKNYRSSQQLLDASHSLILKNKTNLSMAPRLVSSGNQSRLKLTIAECANLNSEFNFIKEDILSKLKKGTRPEEIAIIYRNNKDALSLKRFFEGSELAFSLHSESDPIEDDDIRKLLIILKVADNPSSDEALAEALYVDFLKLNNIDVHRLISESNKSKIPLSVMIESQTFLRKARILNRDKFIKFANWVNDWSKRARNESLIDAFENIALESGFLSHIISKDDSLIKLSMYDALLNEVKKTAERHKSARLSTFFEFLDRLDTHKVRLKSESMGAISGRVNLMTAHKSKGLEFDVVYIIHANRGKWGNNRAHGSFFSTPGESADINNEKDDDERRLFYVAMTRSRKEVIITRSLNNEANTQIAPSQFLEEIDQKHLKFVSISEKIYPPQMADSRLAQKPLVDLNDKKYLNQLFMEQGLTVTALNNYLRCPWQYFFLNLIRIPKSQSMNQVYGTAIHETLKIFFDNYQKNQEMKGKVLLNLFEDYLSRKHIAEKNYGQLLSKGKKALSGYLTFYRNKWPRAILSEFNISGVLLAIKYRGKELKLLLRGKLDKVELGQGSEVNVVDYKTGRPKTRNQILGTNKLKEDDYLRQLIFYKLLLDRYKNKKLNIVSGEIDFVEPDSKGRYHKEKIAISDEMVQKLSELISKSSAEILDLSFWNKTCDQKKCQYCALSTLINKSKRQRAI